MYDLVIVGAGPGGMTAAIYAARRKINFAIISLDVGGQMSWSTEVENYPGFEHISGVELTKDFLAQIKKYKIKIKQEEVLEVGKKGIKCFVRTKNNFYESKAVIIASGKSPRKLEIPGEKEFIGRGVYYSVTPYTPFYRGKNVAVIGAGNSGLEASLYLANYAKKVYIFSRTKVLAGESYLRDKVLNNKKIKIISEAEIKEIIGDSSVKKIKFLQGGKILSLNVRGVFIEIGLITKVDFIKCKKNEYGEIMIFRTTKTHEENMTSLPGIFAAGDVTDIPAKQIVVAAGEGAKAALASFDYISRWDKKYKNKK